MVASAPHDRRRSVSGDARAVRVELIVYSEARDVRPSVRCRVDEKLGMDAGGVDVKPAQAYRPEIHIEIFGLHGPIACQCVLDAATDHPPDLRRRSRTIDVRAATITAYA